MSLTYLARCETFWQLNEMVEKKPALKPTAEMVELWTEQIRRGEVPEFGPHLLY